MTIGIGAYGPRAGEAVFFALQQVELIGKGSIGGFAVYAAIKNDGELVYYTTQRGGTKTLVTRGEVTGVLPPADVFSANIAGVISSGPDREEPLKLGLPAKAGVGLVTGHRLPRSASRVHGKPMNQVVLELMETGVDADIAVTQVLNENLERDVGLIAVSVNGTMRAQNSSKVERRPDVAKIYREDPTKNAKVAVLMNSIHPVPAAAEVAAGIAMDIMTEKHTPDFELQVKVGSTIEVGARDEVHVDANHSITRLVTSDDACLIGKQRCSIPYIGAKVIQNGQVIGYAITEASTHLEDGVIVSFRYGTEASIGVRLV